MEFRVIQAGKNCEIDDGFEGSLKIRKMKRFDGMRLADQLSKEVSAAEDPIEGVKKLISELDKIYTDVDLKYGSHEFKNIESLWETDKGEELVNKVLIPKIAGAVPLSKN